MLCKSLWDKYFGLPFWHWRKWITFISDKEKCKIYTNEQTFILWKLMLMERLVEDVLTWQKFGKSQKRDAEIHLIPRPGKLHQPYEAFTNWNAGEVIMALTLAATKDWELRRSSLFSWMSHFPLPLSSVSFCCLVVNPYIFCFDTLFFFHKTMYFMACWSKIYSKDLLFSHANTSFIIFLRKK